MTQKVKIFSEYDAPHIENLINDWLTFMSETDAIVEIKHVTQSMDEGNHILISIFYEEYETTE